MKNRVVLIVFIVMIPFFLLLSSGSSQYSIQESEKVFRLIEEIQVDQLEKEENEIKSVEVTESEFNSWIAYRIETEKEEIMKELRFKIFDDNKIEGKIYLDLRGHNLPKLLRPEMNLYFGGSFMAFL